MARVNGKKVNVGDHYYFKGKGIYKVCCIIDGLGDLSFSEEEKERLYLVTNESPVLMFGNGWKINTKDMERYIKLKKVIKANNKELLETLYE